MATMTRLSFIPARCWIAPEMPTATYRSGATILPVWPTCQSFGTKPASTAAREAPIAAPSLSASGSSSLKLSPEPMPRPRETTMRAEVSSGRSDFDTSRPTKLERPLSAGAARGHRVEAGGAHRDHLDLVARLHCGERIAGVDRPHEGVGRLDGDDLGDRLHVEQRGRARHHVLAVRGRGREQVRIALGERGEQRADVLGDLVVELRGVRVQHFRDPGNLCGGLRRATALVAGDQQVDLAADLLRGSDRAEGRLLDRLVVVLGEYEDRHQITFASFLSFSTSALASATFTPPLRFAGSVTLSVFRRGATSTPSASGFRFSSGFFFAFMMFGSVT